MRKIVQNTTGGPEVLVTADAPAPAAGPGEVVVAVRAAGINPVDAAVREGLFPLLGEAPFTLGWDIAGEVTEVGEGVGDLTVGDSVFGMPRFPAEAAAYAQFADAPADELAPTPDALSTVEAGGLPLAGLTAWQALVTHGGLEAGQRVLIHAGAGGVGHIAVQIAKALGAYVVASASAAKLDFVRSIGADEVFDYTAGDFPSGDEPFDLVLDPIGGEHVERSLAVARRGGTVISLLDPSEAANAQAESDGKRLERIVVAPDGAGLRSLADLATAGKLKVHVARTFRLEDAPDAHRFLLTHPIGKVVLAA